MYMYTLTLYRIKTIFKEQKWLILSSNSKIYKTKAKSVRRTFARVGRVYRKLQTAKGDD